MTEHRHDQHVPRGALLGALVLILSSTALAASARSANLATQAAAGPGLPPTESADVRFVDEPNGGLAVIDASSDRQVYVMAPGSNNFVRGVLRGMFRGRKLESLDRSALFRLTREADGRLNLLDPLTGRRVDLASFGPTNLASFEAILAAVEGAR